MALRFATIAQVHEARKMLPFGDQNVKPYSHLCGCANLIGMLIHMPVSLHNSCSLDRITPKPRGFLHLLMGSVDRLAYLTQGQSGWLHKTLKKGSIPSPVAHANKNAGRTTALTFPSHKGVSIISHDQTTSALVRC